MAYLVEFLANLFGFGRQYRKYVRPFVPHRTGKRQPIPKEVRRFLLWQAGYKCQKCGAKGNLQVDHVVPWSRGGTDDVWNLQILCAKCNRQKSNHNCNDYR